MMSKLEVTVNDLEQGAAAAKDLLLEATLYRPVETIPNDLQSFFGVYCALSSVFAKEQLFQHSEDRLVVNDFENVLALSLAAKYAKNGVVRRQGLFPSIEYSVRGGAPLRPQVQLAAKILASFVEGSRYNAIESYSSEDVCRSFLDWLPRDTQRWLAKKNGAFSGLAKNVHDLEVLIGNQRFLGFSKDTQRLGEGIGEGSSASACVASVDGAASKSSKYKKKMIGNEEMMRALWAGANYLRFYDPETKTNDLAEPGEPVPAILILGPPGCGKSFGTTLVARELAEIMKQEKRELRVLDISNTFKSKYVNESVGRLATIFDEIASGEAAYYVTCHDAESVFFRRNPDRDTKEDEKTLNELLNRLSGHRQLPYPNAFFVFNGNFKEMLDYAVLDRVSIVEAHGPRTAVEYEELWKVHLAPCIASGFARVHAWKRLGMVSKSLGLSGRQVQNIVKLLRQKALPSCIPIGVPTLPKEERQKRLRELAGSITDEVLFAELMRLGAEKRVVPEKVVEGGV
ncbi:AAA family ATPase [Candidatus Woesearchaeota archaeon]|nr:MAG: AAA family ATPase [Candidatus Woesearchaeota archaeon]